MLAELIGYRYYGVGAPGLCRKMGREEILWHGFMKSAIQKML